ncbi:MAG: aspartate carbamoyltransferase regulatory subunit, partial [Clostridia bacterium]|nr:aspartate carbamoyltransferase regulatory subunit [Clostridia bacterium]
MKIDAIKNGLVIDHIEAGKGMEVYNFLNLDELDCSVALIKNVFSKKTGKKDIIKIDSAIEINLDVLGYIAPEVTVNIIKDG